MLKILKGNIVFTKNKDKFEVFEDSHIIIKDGKVLDIQKALSDEYKNIEVEDLGDKIIIPGFNDIHLHAPQYPNLGLGLDKELLPWLETYTFPEEAKNIDPEYAKKEYKLFVKSLWKYGTTRAVVFASLHQKATEILMDYFNEVGMGAYVGKVNMNRNSPDNLIETTKDSIKRTENILKKYNDKNALVQPIITPRFVPSCDTELMNALGNLAEKYDVKVQSHLSENKGEIAWVKDLHPESKNYADVYDKAKLFGQQPTVMAHCIYVTEDEMDLMAKNQVYVAHCPTSNFNLSSGIAPIRKFLNKNIPVGIGTDISAGHTVSMMTTIVTAIQASKMYWLYVNDDEECLSTTEAFYLATKGGGSFFGKVGSFEKDYEFDALVIDDSSLSDYNKRTIEERIQRFIYTGDDRQISKRYVRGKELKEPFMDIK